MKTLKLLFLLLLIFPIYCNAQENRQKSIFEKDFSKHEIGISWGAFPTSGIFFGIDFATSWGLLSNFDRIPTLGPRYPFFAHQDSWEWDAYRNENKVREYYHMKHYGSLTFNYQYYFTKKHSIGFTASWLGRHISSYTMKPTTSEIINAKGWDNIFSLCINYRFTYYSKEAVSLYTGVHLGFGMGFIERKLLFESESSFYALPALQITGFGIEAGKKHAFIAELGFGCQGLMKIGYRYKFKNN